MIQPLVIQVEATLLPYEEGGRAQVPVFDDGGRYMPHLVVQAPNVRNAVVVDGNVIVEDYLPVAFVSGPSGYVAGKCGRFAVELMYYPEIGYEALEEGATFTIREGAKVIGFGAVISRPTPESD